MTPLPPGADLRLPEYRAEVWQRFYSFHLKYRSHPGGVYYLMPYLSELYGWTLEERLWFAYLNGNTQHPATSLMLFRRSPTLAGAEHTLSFYDDHYLDLAWDTDRRYHKKAFRQAVEGLTRILAGRTLTAYWTEVAAGGWPAVWAAATALPTFGRLSAFSFSEYLKVSGLEFDCTDLMLRDIAGSKSHRNGLCLVEGLDTWVDHKSNPGFAGSYTPGQLDILETHADELLAEARSRAAGEAWAGDVSFFTLESALCTYKSWHRPNRRYPNVYNDMLHDRLKLTQARWPAEDLQPFWDARAAALPDRLLLERTPFDPGCVPVKQNHYLHTGETIMMETDFPDMGNTFAELVASGGYASHRKYK